MLQTLDVYKAAFAALSRVSIEEVEFKTTSQHKEFLTGRIIDGDIATLEKSSTSKKVFEIASITKTFTAATIVKLAADSRYKKFFDKDDPMNTKISTFEDFIASDVHNYGLGIRKTKKIACSGFITVALLLAAMIMLSRKKILMIWCSF